MPLLRPVLDSLGAESDLTFVRLGNAISWLQLAPLETMLSAAIMMGLSLGEDYKLKRKQRTHE